MGATVALEELQRGTMVALERRKSLLWITGNELADMLARLRSLSSDGSLVPMSAIVLKSKIKLLFENK